MKESRCSTKVLSIVEETEPKVLADFIEEQCDVAVKALDNIQNIVPNNVYKSEMESGDTECVSVYDLGAGTAIVVEGIDEADDINTSDANDLFTPCAIKTATWVTNKNIDKQYGDRRYTAIYNLIIAKTEYGKITVSNHYTVNKANIKIRKAEVWEYEGRSPLSISMKGSPAMSSTTEITKPGGEIYAKSEFYVTSNRNSTVSVGTEVGADVGVTIAGSTSTSVTWEENSTKLHKIYAAVDLNKFTSTGANMKHWGKVTYAD